jgi:hypothetical protein
MSGRSKITRHGANHGRGGSDPIIGLDTTTLARLSKTVGSDPDEALSGDIILKEGAGVDIDEDVPSNTLTIHNAASRWQLQPDPDHPTTQDVWLIGLPEFSDASDLHGTNNKPATWDDFEVPGAAEITALGYRLWASAERWQVVTGVDHLVRSQGMITGGAASVSQILAGDISGPSDVLVSDDGDPQYSTGFNEWVQVTDEDFGTITSESVRFSHRHFGHSYHVDKFVVVLAWAPDGSGGPEGVIPGVGFVWQVGGDMQPIWAFVTNRNIASRESLDEENQGIDVSKLEPGLDDGQVLKTVPVGGGRTAEWSDRTWVEWLGDWDTGTAYAVNDAVVNDDVLYICILAHTGQEPPNGTYWDVLASGGATVDDATISTSDVTTNNVSSSKHGWAPKSPADATKFLNGAATPAYALVKDSDLDTSDVITNNATTAKHGFLKKLSNDATNFFDGTGVWRNLVEADLALTDITTNDVSITKHGFAPKAPNDVAKFLRGDGTWNSPGGGGGGASTVATDVVWDTKGDIVAATGADAASKVAVGADYAVLESDSAATPGIAWKSSWTSYTPALTASPTSPTLGSGSTVVGSWFRVGKHVVVRGSITFGSSGVNAGSGNYFLSLPFTAAGNWIGFAWVFDNSTGEGRLAAIRSDGLMWGNGAFAALSNSNPWTWAASDQIQFNLSYECT